mmetsp:Transcript_17049/g.48005  ORF Transcript_17049/g.48005 Transcript_17049/m.48005 type:complete len:300 (+) Transcript_17049:114-1013(+)
MASALNTVIGGSVSRGTRTGSTCWPRTAMSCVSPFMTTSRSWPSPPWILASMLGRISSTTSVPAFRTRWSKAAAAASRTSSSPSTRPRRTTSTMSPLLSTTIPREECSRILERLRNAPWRFPTSRRLASLTTTGSTCAMISSPNFTTSVPRVFPASCRRSILSLRIESILTLMITGRISRRVLAEFGATDFHTRKAFCRTAGWTSERMRKRAARMLLRRWRPSMSRTTRACSSCEIRSISSPVACTAICSRRSPRRETEACRMRQLSLNSPLSKLGMRISRASVTVPYSAMTAWAASKA